MLGISGFEPIRASIRTKKRGKSQAMRPSLAIGQETTMAPLVYADAIKTPVLENRAGDGRTKLSVFRALDSAAWMFMLASRDVAEALLHISMLLS